MSTVVNIQEAKTNLSRLIAEAQNGEEVIIANRGTPVIKLEPIKPPTKRNLGIVKLPPIPDEFFDPISDEEIKSWGLL
jgi:prevent-host-death family protein